MDCPLVVDKSTKSCFFKTVTSTIYHSSGKNDVHAKYVSITPTSL